MEYIMSDTGSWIEFSRENSDEILNEIRKALVIQTAAILQLQNEIKNLSCCNPTPQPTPPQQVISSGQAFLDIRQITPLNFPILRKSDPLVREVIKNDDPKKPIVNSPKAYYKVQDGYFPIVGTGNGWKINGDKIVDGSGQDLERFLPIRLDKDRSIIGYVVRHTSQGIQPILIYKGIDQFGEDRILEGGIYFWRQFFK